jgi:hypothetical protein
MEAGATFKLLPNGGGRLGMRYTYVVQTNIPTATFGLENTSALTGVNRSYLQLQNENVCNIYVNIAVLYNARFDCVNSICWYISDERNQFDDLNQL